jgi:putative copper export protein
MSATILLDQVAAAVHLLSAAAWFGALVYRAFFVDPKAKRYFAGGAGYERFSLDLAHGMRYVVLIALLTCGLSGFALVGLRWSPANGWLELVAGKAGLWAVAFALFAYISWVFWPRRVFAEAAEWPAVRRQGLALALVMIGIAGLGIVLGQAARLAAAGAFGT